MANVFLFQVYLMIYHLILPKDWERILSNNQNVYKAPSLKQEGFIHCSTKAQLIESARLYFPEVDKLVVLGIVEKRVKKLLKWEGSRNNEEFPHIYGPIPMEAIETMDIISRNEEGEWTW